MNHSAGVELREAAARDSAGAQGEFRYVQDALSRTILDEARRCETDDAALRESTRAALADAMRDATLAAKWELAAGILRQLETLGAPAEAVAGPRDDVASAC